MRLAATARPQLIASSSTMPKEARSQGVQNTSPRDQVVRAAAVETAGEVHVGACLVGDHALVERAQRTVADDDQAHGRAAFGEQQLVRVDHRVDAVPRVEPADEDDRAVVAHQVPHRLCVGGEVLGVDAVGDDVIGVRKVRRERADAGLTDADAAVQALDRGPDQLGLNVHAQRLREHAVEGGDRERVVGRVVDRPGRHLRVVGRVHVDDVKAPLAEERAQPAAQARADGVRASLRRCPSGERRAGWRRRCARPRRWARARPSASSCTGGGRRSLPVTTVTSWPSSVSARACPSTCSLMPPSDG